MRPAVVVAMLSQVLPIASSAQTVEGFRFRPDKVETAMVYHYVKSNLDGTNPGNIALFVASPTRLEAFKYRPGGTSATLVIAEMDWTIFSATRLESWQWSGPDNPTLFGTLTYDNSEQAVIVDIPTMGVKETTPIEHLPFHLYDFDFASLNVAFRHLIDPEGEFTIGIADPTYQQTSPIFAYRGEVTVSYVGRETRNGVACRMYRIDGAGLEHKGGFMWVSRADEHIVEFGIELGDEPGQQGVNLSLQRVEEMSPSAWQQFMRSQF